MTQSQAEKAQASGVAMTRKLRKAYKLLEIGDVEGSKSLIRKTLRRNKVRKAAPPRPERKP